MSKERERKIIDGVIKKLLEFDITIENYFYTVSKECSDVFEVSLEHKDTGALILIKNINVDSKNNIVKIGINKGLVL